MTNPAQISITTATENVTTANEISQVVIEYGVDGSITLTTIATQQIEVGDQSYQGATSRYKAIAPSLAEAAARAETMFQGEPDAAAFTADKVAAMFSQLGRYFARFHTTQEALAEAEKSEIQEMHES